MLVVAHLTDIHIRFDGDPILQRADQIGAALSSHSADASHLVILLTGDIAFSGLESEYGLALELLRKVEGRIRRDFSGELSFVACPGNHDCDFSGPQGVRDLVLRQISEKPTASISEEFLSHCVSVQRAFFDFLEKLSGKRLSVTEQLNYRFEFQIDGVSVAFDCLNVAWTSKLKEEKLSFPASILPPARAHVGCLITALHHPFNWLHPSSYREFRRRVRVNSDFLFSGHEHEWGLVETEERESGSCVHFEGGVLQQSDPNDSGFSVTEFDFGLKRYRAFNYKWNVSSYERQDLGLWADFRRFELTAPADSWVITGSFNAELSDLGVVLRVGGRAEVTLEDVFVFPDLEISAESEDVSQVVQGEALLSDGVQHGGFVLQGDDRSGRTTLLKYLYRRYCDDGLVPVLIPADRFTRATEEEIDSVLDAHVREQYGKDGSKYYQLPLAKRVLLVDDFDETPIRSERARGQLLARLRARCGVLVLSVGDVFEAAHLVDPEDGHIYESLPAYRILPFGRLSRAKLIGKWVTVDSDDFLSEEERISRIDSATKYVDTVVRWNVVPRYPVYLLTLLQAHKAGSSETFKDSGLGHYYQYLISDSMLSAGVDKAKLTDVEQYCTQLAWWMKELGRNYISQDELAAFNKSFASKWVTLDFRSLIEQLLRSGIVRRVGAVLEFRYGYINYFFIAKYLAENFDDPSVQAFVFDAVKSLYVRSNANILVFLTHFANKASVIDTIVETLNAQFAEVPLAKFAVRNQSVEVMLASLPSVVYDGGHPEKNRESEARHLDEVGTDSRDGLRDKAEGETELSLSAKLTIVFKTVEILGQILKTQYSRIPRNRRREIIRDMLDGPLRALEVFYLALSDNPDALVAEFEARLAEEKRELPPDERRTLAQRTVGSMVLGVTFGFIRKAAESVGAESIGEDLCEVADGDGQLGRMLIRLAALLDGQRPLPRVEIERIRKQGAKSLIVDRVVQVLVVYHMYMFRTSFEDIRWAHDVLGIPSRVRLRALLSGGLVARPD